MWLLLPSVPIPYEKKAYEFKTLCLVAVFSTMLSCAIFLATSQRTPSWAEGPSQPKRDSYCPVLRTAFDLSPPSFRKRCLERPFHPCSWSVLLRVLERTFPGFFSFSQSRLLNPRLPPLSVDPDDSLPRFRRDMYLLGFFISARSCV